MTTATAIVAGHGIAFRRSLHLPNPPGKPCAASFSVARHHAHYGRLAVPATPSPRPCRSISSESPTAAAADTAEDEEEPPEEEEEEDDEVDPLAEVCYLDPDADAEGIREWEVDFCSRPILDARGKKVWELVVCDATLSLQFTRFFPNTSINSVTLRDALASVASSLGVPLPDRARFFRSQMQTIISRACNDLGVKAVPSRRCVSLLLWLEERYETVYSRHPGFQQGTKPLLTLDNPFASNLPDNLFGDKWPSPLASLPRLLPPSSHPIPASFPPQSATPFLLDVEQQERPPVEKEQRGRRHIDELDSLRRDRTDAVAESA